MCLPKWKDLKNIFSFIFEGFQLQQKKFLAYYFLSSALSKMYTSLPSSLSYSGQTWRLLSFKKKKKNPSFSLCVPPKISLHYCTIFHVHILRSLRVSLIFNAHLQKVEFPLVNAYYVLTTILCAENWSSASNLSTPGTYFQIFKKWILVSKLRVMGFFIQSGGLPQAGYELWSFQ